MLSAVGSVNLSSFLRFGKSHLLQVGDIGANSARQGLVEYDGVKDTYQLVNSKRDATSQSFDPFINQVVSAYPDKQIEASSLAVAGPVQMTGPNGELIGKVLGTNTKAFGTGSEVLGESLSNVFSSNRNMDIKAFVINDADGFAYGATKTINFKDPKNVLGVTLGSGVGVGLVVNDKLEEYNGFSIAEGGHIMIGDRPEFDGRPNPRNTGAFELYCSGPGLQYTANEIARSVGVNAPFTDSKTVVEESKKPLRQESMPTYFKRLTAKLAMQRWHEDVARGITSLLNFRFVPSVAVGGGLAKEVDYKWLTNRVKSMLWYQPALKDQLEIKPGSADETEALIGAARWAVDQLHLKPQQPIDAKIL
jgi:glucokinase